MDGVVEIARGFAVDGDDGEIAEIAPAVELGLGYGLRRGLGLCEDVFGERVRQVMLADDDFDVHADVAGTAENFDDAAGGRDAAFRGSA